MDYVGLTRGYKVNRPLTEQEKEYHKLQDKPSHSSPLYHEQIIRLNSTYLECVDKFFMNKGVISALMIGLLGGFGVFFYLAYLLIHERSEYLIALGMFLIAFIMSSITLFLLSRECFAYTHFPIRFNRKTRKVHVFRFNGTVMTEDWDKLYFTCCQRTFMDWEVRGHRLDAAGEKVLETFGLPAPEGSAWKTSFWEYVRCYMEAQDPEELTALAQQIRRVPEIADGREGFWVGLGRVSSDIGPVFAFLLFPVALAYGLGRWIANHTSRIPRWPAEIEADCQIEPNDLNRRDAQKLY